MEPKKQGGKRRGAGRKPILSKKKQVSLYVEGNKIIKFGSEDKMKGHLYNIIDEFGVSEIVAITPPPESFDCKKIDKFTLDEPAMFQEVKPKIDQYTAYEREINSANSITEVEDIVKELKKDESLAQWQKIRLEKIGVEKSKTFDF